jgi:hypothetical protein
MPKINRIITKLSLLRLGDAGGDLPHNEVKKVLVVAITLTEVYVVRLTQM